MVRHAWMKWVIFAVVCFLVGLCGPMVAFGQQGPLVPIPQQPQQPNPCFALQQQVAMCAAQCTVWDSIVTQKTASLAAAQAGLETWQGLLELFWAGVAGQQGPLTPGQEMSLASITQSIVAAKSFIRTTTAELLNAQQNLQGWKQSLQQAQQAFAAAGC